MYYLRKKKKHILKTEFLILEINQHVIMHLLSASPKYGTWGSSYPPPLSYAARNSGTCLFCAWVEEPRREQVTSPKARWAIAMRVTRKSEGDYTPGSLTS